MDEEENILELVLRYGRMKYSPNRICQLLGLDITQTSEFLRRIEEPGDPIRIKYEQGKAFGDYEEDKYLKRAGKKGNPMAIAELGTRQYHRRQDELKKDLFGL